jgi:hypothetical protein
MNETTKMNSAEPTAAEGPPAPLDINQIINQIQAILPLRVSAVKLGVLIRVHPRRSAVSSCLWLSALISVIRVNQW